MIYFNNAATSYPKPALMIDAIVEHLKLPPTNPYRENVTQEAIADRCRQHITRLFNFPAAERVIFCSGATEALNMAINGIIEPGDHVITTQLEHNAVLRPLFQLRRQGRISLEIIPCRSPGRLSLADLRQAMRDETALVVINHASNVTGAVLDLEPAYELCAARDIPLVVDLSQSAGTIAQDLSRMSRAVFAFTGHKSLLGPKGCGGLLVGEAITLQPWKVGGSGIRSDLEEMPEMWPLKYEPGTMNEPGIAGLAAGVDHILKQGIAHFSRTKRELVAHLVQELERIDGVTIYAEEAEQNHCGVVSFTAAGVPTGDAGYILQESFDIRVRTGLHCAPLIHQALGTFPSGTIRVSFSATNTHDEVDAFVQAMRAIKGSS